MLLRVSSNQQLEADGDLSVQRQLVLEYIENVLTGSWMKKNISKEVTVDTKIRLRTEMFYRMHCRMPEIKNMTFWLLIKMTVLVAGCGKLVLMLCH